MARLLTCGFEFQSVIAEVGAPTVTGTATIDTTNPRGPGLAAMSCGPANNYAEWAITTTLGRLYYSRVAFRSSAAAAVGSNQSLMGHYNAAGQIHLMFLDTAGEFIGWCNTPGSVTGSFSGVQANTWYVIEMMTKVVVSGNGQAAMRVRDGNGKLLYDSGVTTLALPVNSALTKFRFGHDGASDTACTFLEDDIAINDDQGSNQNSWPGDGHVVLLKPTADNSRTGVTGGAGGTTNLFDAVDNRPPAGLAVAVSNTSQIVAPNANTTDNYVAQAQSLSAAGVNNSMKPVVAQAVMRFASSTNFTGTYGLSCTQPTIAEETPNWPGSVYVSEPSTTWTTAGTAPLYNPAMTNTTTPLPKYRRAQSTGGTQGVDVMGLQVEVAPTSLASPSRASRHPLLRR